LDTVTVNGAAATNGGCSPVVRFPFIATSTMRPTPLACRTISLVDAWKDPTLPLPAVHNRNGRASRRAYCKQVSLDDDETSVVRTTQWFQSSKCFALSYRLRWNGVPRSDARLAHIPDCRRSTPQKQDRTKTKCTTHSRVTGDG
jgi:hypothetical protein